MSNVSSGELQVRGVHLHEADVPDTLLARCARGAFSSIARRKIDAGDRNSRAGYSAALIPVPTPTSSTRSPGLMFIRSNRV